jgi:hypothetical protein
MCSSSNGLRVCDEFRAGRRGTDGLHEWMESGVACEGFSYISWSVVARRLEFHFSQALSGPVDLSEDG